MPLTSRAFVKASILYLGLGAVLGALLLVDRWLGLEPRLLLLRSSHVQVLVVGWLTQLILGVAWWLFPPLKIGLGRSSEPRRRGQAQRGSERLIWFTFFALNAGILLRAIGEPLYGWTQIPVFNALSGTSGIFLLAATVAFVANMWARVRELGRKRN